MILLALVLLLLLAPVIVLLVVFGIADPGPCPVCGTPMRMFSTDPRKDWCPNDCKEGSR